MLVHFSTDELVSISKVDGNTGRVRLVDVEGIPRE